MQRHRHHFSRPFSWLLTCTICIPIALTVVLAAPDASAQGLFQQTPAAPSTGAGLLSRLFGTPAAEQPAAQPPPRVKKVRAAKRKKRPRPVAAQPAPAKQQTAPAQQQSAPSQQESAEAGWPNAAANVGGPMIVPPTIKTVREMIEPEPETPVVVNDELSDIDLAAQPVAEASPEPEATSPVSTDGLAEAEPDASVGETSVLAMSDTIKSIVELPWLEPLLLAFAGMIATFSAVRLFA